VPGGGKQVAPEGQKARLEEIRNRVLELLQTGPRPETGGIAFSPALAQEWLDEHFALLPARYPLSLAPELIARQILLAKRACLTGAAVDVMTVAAKDYTRLLICCADFPGLFAGVTGMLAAMNVNIIGAQLETRGDGIVADVLWISSPAGTVISDSNSLRDIANKVEWILKNHSKSRLPFRKLFPPAMVSSAAPPLRPPQIRLSNEISGNHTVLEILAEDRLALAYSISICLTTLGLTIHSAKLSTEKAMIHDVFDLTELTGEKLPPNRWDEVIAALQNTLNGTP
jgi:[protein-PII] uridylyltransferase